MEAVVQPYCRRQARFLTCDIADFTPSPHAQSDIPGHTFRKRWLLTDIFWVRNRV